MKKPLVRILGKYLRIHTLIESPPNEDWKNVGYALQNGFCRQLIAGERMFGMDRSENVFHRSNCFRPTYQ